MCYKDYKATLPKKIYITKWILKSAEKLHWKKNYILFLQLTEIYRKKPKISSHIQKQEVAKICFCNLKREEATWSVLFSCRKVEINFWSPTDLSKWYNLPYPQVRRQNHCAPQMQMNQTQPLLRLLIIQMLGLHGKRNAERKVTENIPGMNCFR